MNNKTESVQHSNIDESDMGALHAIHVHMNAIAAIQRQLGSGPSLFVCVDCGAKIPELRRLAVAGCKHCIDCKAAQEQM